MSCSFARILFHRSKSCPAFAQSPLFCLGSSDHRLSKHRRITLTNISSDTFSFLIFFSLSRSLRRVSSQFALFFLLIFVHPPITFPLFVSVHHLLQLYSQSFFHLLYSLLSLLSFHLFGVSLYLHNSPLSFGLFINFLPFPVRFTIPNQIITVSVSVSIVADVCRLRQLHCPIAHQILLFPFDAFLVLIKFHFVGR